jgi:Astacin (Peptidase family M12A)
MRTFCSMREPPPRVFRPEVGGERARAIVSYSTKWVNGSVLRYAFFPDTDAFATWYGSAAQKKVVRDAIKLWADLGIGLRLEEVTDLAESDIRIGFQRADGHWSYIGRDVRNQGKNDRTMNLDPDAGNFDIDTAAHELGHTLGLPHEHQNPNAGIVWDEEAVYAALAAPPNRWSRETTFHNIIRKLPSSSVHGSTWDPNSIMHYAFEQGLIKEPQPYRAGLNPAGGLSSVDKAWIKHFYPPMTGNSETALMLLESQRLAITAGEQRNFLIKPAVTRYYELRSFGASDSVFVLFERPKSGDDLYLTGDDDSGEDRNAYIRRRLHAGRTYVLRIRLFHAESAGDTGVMWW